MKYETTEQYLARGGKILVLPLYQPKGSFWKYNNDK